MEPTSPLMPPIPPKVEVVSPLPKELSSMSQQTAKLLTILITLLFLIFVAYVAWSEYRAQEYQRMLEELKASRESDSQELDALKASSTEDSASLTNLYTTLSDVINEEKTKNQTLEERLGMVSNTVGSLDKLSKADPQLLKKYSKIYFLNDNYAPVSLTTIPSEETYIPKNPYQINTDVYPFLQNMLDDAKRDGINLLVISAYRSFQTQATVKQVNVVRFGTTKANQFSAEQGFSEHQLGTTLDFTTTKTGANFIKFDGTPEYTWLQNNAYRYGFVLSYPKGNSYYAYEPWHWRFVGIELAGKLRADEKYFYNLDQRTIDTYLTKMFDR